MSEIKLTACGDSHVQRQEGSWMEKGAYPPEVHLEETAGGILPQGLT